ncbi:MurR/RpiR family transcriptional regulator [Yoonia sp. GPGPB17]|uniref:MurR/RpiR family transcriptional regulator n=1 Tax=Yoonia sp. GPGPB17 TaxID=3026147 RepID=UPI0030BDEFF9
MLVRDLLEQHKGDFTAAERRVIPFLRDPALLIELQSITKLANAAEVSTPTIIRLARKLGYDGYPDLHGAVRLELAERIKQPLAKLKAQPEHPKDDHIVNQFAHVVVENVNNTINQIDFPLFDQAAELLAEPSRRVQLIGGRITWPIAHYFANHLHIIRPNVTLLNPSQNAWPQSVLDMDESSVLIIFDIRRYEKKIARLTRLAQKRKAKIMLFTDQWGSPIENDADICFRAPVQAPSSWDSMVALNFLVESMVAQIQRSAPDQTGKRIAEMESLIGDSGIF